MFKSHAEQFTAAKAKRACTLVVMPPRLQRQDWQRATPHAHHHRSSLSCPNLPFAARCEQPARAAVPPPQRCRNARKHLANTRSHGVSAARPPVSVAPQQHTGVPQPGTGVSTLRSARSNHHGPSPAAVSSDAGSGCTGGLHPAGQCRRQRHAAGGKQHASARKCHAAAGLAGS